MSKFTLAVAEKIAALAVRSEKTRSNPLNAGELLYALRRAEIAHDAEVVERENALATYRHDRKMFQQHEQFYKRFSDVMKHWRKMEEPTKDRLIHYTQNHLQTIEQARDVIPLARLRKRCDDTLNAIALAANQGALSLRGRRSGTSQSVPDQNKSLRPLYAFAAELKAFWEINAGRASFGQQFDGIVPLSAASKLMVESVKLLKVKYQPGNIQTVMRMLASKRVKTFPDDEFMISFRRLPGF